MIKKQNLTILNSLGFTDLTSVGIKFRFVNNPFQELNYL